MNEDLREVLRHELTQLFPYKELLPEGELAYEGQKIETFPVGAVLASRLPHYRFYRTQLTTSYLEYTFVEIIAAINEQDHKNVRILFSPTFTPHSPKFFELFVGLIIQKTADKVHVTEAVAEMLARLTFEGRTEPVEISNGRHIYNLYRQDELHYHLLFEFDATGVLTAVQVTKSLIE